MLQDEAGRAITFQCQDCTGREPQLVPQIHPNGEIINHVPISDLQNHEEKQTEQSKAIDEADDEHKEEQENEQIKEQKD